MAAGSAGRLLRRLAGRLMVDPAAAAAAVLFPAGTWAALGPLAALRGLAGAAGLTAAAAAAGLALVGGAGAAAGVRWARL